MNDAERTLRDAQSMAEYYYRQGWTEAEFIKAHVGEGLSLTQLRKMWPGQSEPTSDDWAPIDLTELLNGTFEPPQAVWGKCANGGVCLLYPGRSHSIAGFPGSGKSMCAQFIAAQSIIEDDACVLYIDYEDDALGVAVDRMRDTFGVPVEKILSNFNYLNPVVAPNEQQMAILANAR